MRWMRAVYRSVQLQQPRPPAFHNIVDGFSLKKGRLLTCVLATRAGKRWTLFKRPQSAHSPSHFEKKKFRSPFAASVPNTLAGVPWWMRSCCRCYSCGKRFSCCHYTLKGALSTQNSRRLWTAAFAVCWPPYRTRCGRLSATARRKVHHRIWPIKKVCWRWAP